MRSPLTRIARTSLALVALITATTAASHTASPPDPSTAATKELQSLFHDDWERNLRENPTFASTLGDRRWNGQWGDETLTAYAKSHDEDGAALERLHKVDRKALPDSERLNYDLFERDLHQRLDGYRFHSFLMPVAQNGGPADAARQLTEDLRLDRAGLRRLARAHPRRARVSRSDHGPHAPGMKEGRVPPKILMQRVPRRSRSRWSTRRSKVLLQAVRRHAFNGLRGPPAVLPPQRAARHHQRRPPAYRAFQKFFLEEYQPACRDTIAATALPTARRSTPTARARSRPPT